MLQYKQRPRLFVSSCIEASIYSLHFTFSLYSTRAPNRSLSSLCACTISNAGTITQARKLHRLIFSPSPAARLFDSTQEERMKVFSNYCLEPDKAL